MKNDYKGKKGGSLFSLDAALIAEDAATSVKAFPLPSQTEKNTSK